MLTWLRNLIQRLFASPAVLGQSGRAAIDFSRRCYRAYNLPPHIERGGLDRLEHGLARYGPDAFTQMSEARWLQEPLEELLDAFNMLGGMMSARGEAAFSISGLEITILDVQARLNEIRSCQPSTVGARTPSSAAAAPLSSTPPMGEPPMPREGTP